MMVSYCALAVLAVLVGANAQTQPCSKQLELEHRCMLTIESSPEANKIRDRKHDIMKKCAPSIPTDCHAQFQAAQECVMNIAKNMDNDPLFTESKSKSQPAVDECFAKNPPDVKKGFEEIFMSMKPPHKMHKRWHEKQDNDTSSGESSAEVSSSSGEDSSNETSSFERRHGGGGRGGGGRGGGGRGGRGGHGRHCHHGGHGGRGGHGGHGGRGGHGGHGHHHRPGVNGENNSSSSESNESNNSSESGGKSGGKWERHQKDERPECRKTPQQIQCVKDEFKKLGQDVAFIDIMNTLIRQKKKCKQIVDWSCSPKCPKRAKCIFKATKPCRDVFMQRMKTCMTEKGFTLPPFMQGGATEIFTTPLPVIKH